MDIIFDERTKCFHLRNKQVSYIMKVIKGGYLAHMYWGRRIEHYHESNSIVLYDRGFCANPNPEDRTFSLDTLPQEYSSYGNSDFRVPSFQVELVDASRICDLRFKDFRIYAGKKKLEGLPCLYVTEKSEARTLEIEMEDRSIGVEVTLIYTIFKDYDVITRSVKFNNTGSDVIKLNRALSASIDFREKDFELITLYGAHTNEKNICRRSVVPGIQMIESSRGASSPQQAPFLALVRKNTDEDQGEVYSFNFIYSGNFVGQVQVDQYSNTRVNMGINDFDFSWTLGCGETFQTPEVVLTYSSHGLNQMSQTYHQLYMNHLCRGKYQKKPRPILINNWEATFFNFNADKIYEIAKVGYELGMELFVLDDGWFKGRNTDKTSLGDWIVDESKLPNGLDDLVKKITDLGLGFGIWFEPEMVSQDSDLYRSHPDWCLRSPHHDPIVGRNQLVLDLSRQDVCDYIIESMSKILDNSLITYVKWDMNRHMTDIYSSTQSSNRQKETAHRYILGLYYILEVLTIKYPNVLFEGCSSGGGRFDAGMLYYMPQTWTSDNTDAVCRMKIQYGTSLVYPPITMGAHVSAVPNNQVGRVTSLQTRGHVAMAANFGYELDLTKLRNEEKNEIKRQICLYKEIRETVQFGQFYRILSPFETNETAWNIVSKDKEEFVAMYFKILSEPATSIRTLKFKGLNSSYLYKDLGTGKIYGGDELMHVGITLKRVKQDFVSQLWRFKRFKG